jgi:hypothetical protein
MQMLKMCVKNTVEKKNILFVIIQNLQVSSSILRVVNFFQ